MGWRSVIRCTTTPPEKTLPTFDPRRKMDSAFAHEKSSPLTMDISAEIWKLLHNIQPLQWIDAPSGLLKGVEGATFANTGTDWNILERYSTLRATPSVLFLARGPFSSNILYWVDVLNSALIVAAQTWQKTFQTGSNRYLGRTYSYSGLNKKQMIRFNLAEMTGFCWRTIRFVAPEALSTRIYAPSTMPMRRLEHNSNHLLLSEWLIYGKWWRFLDIFGPWWLYWLHILVSSRPKAAFDSLGVTIPESEKSTKMQGESVFF